MGNTAGLLEAVINNKQDEVLCVQTAGLVYTMYQFWYINGTLPGVHWTTMVNNSEGLQYTKRCKNSTCAFHLKVSNKLTVYSCFLPRTPIASPSRPPPPHSLPSTPQKKPQTNQTNKCFLRKKKKKIACELILNLVMTEPAGRMAQAFVNTKSH